MRHGASHLSHSYGQRHPFNALKGRRVSRTVLDNKLSNSSNIHLSLMPRSSPASNDRVQVTEASASHPPSCGWHGSRCSSTLQKHVPSSSPERAGDDEATSVGCFPERKKLRCAYRGGRKAPGNVAGMSHLSRVNAPLLSKYAVVAVGAQE